MVRTVYLLFEILSIIVCLFWLFGQRIKITRGMIGLIIIHMGLFTVCWRIGYNGLFSLLMYAVIAVYAWKEFRRPLREVLIRVAVMILLCAVVQVTVACGVEWLSQGNIQVEWSSLCTNLMSLIVFYIIYRKVDIQSMVIYMKGEYRKAKILLSCICCVAASYILYAQKNAEINGLDYLLFFVMAIIIVFLIGTWEKYRVQIREKQIEVEVHEIYADSYKKLIDEIRVRQHEFDNHLQAIINQRYTCHTYEELVEAQSEYINAVSSDNRYNKLPQQGNSVYIGFLYGRLVSLEKQGIMVDCKINIGALNSHMPVYKLIEITNDLLTNASEALILPICIPKPICLRIEETERTIALEVRNIGAPLSMEHIGEYFKKGYSGKGSGRGLGLYNVKKIAEQYGAEILCRNTVMHRRNWISFMVTLQKPTG